MAARCLTSRSSPRWSSYSSGVWFGRPVGQGSPDEPEEVSGKSWTATWTTGRTFSHWSSRDVPTVSSHFPTESFTNSKLATLLTCAGQHSVLSSHKNAWWYRVGPLDLPVHSQHRRGSPLTKPGNNWEETSVNCYNRHCLCGNGWRRRRLPAELQQGQRREDLRSARRQTVPSLT